MSTSGQFDYTASPPRFYGRPSGGATFVMSPVHVPQTTPSQSDPGTGAIGKRQFFIFKQSSKTPNFVFVVGLLLVTMWLESGRKGGIL